VMQTAAGIEIHSLHPLARAIVKETERRNIPYTIADVVTEKIGRGISGIVDGETYTIRGSDEEYRGITLALYRGETLCARLHFRDVLKEGALDFVQGLKREGVRAEIITGDTQENADEFFSSTALVVHAGASPEDKYRLIEEAHARRAVVTMIGDGLNDAPALARADVGVVYSGTENSAAIEAADIAMLDRHIDRIRELFSVSRTTVSIARQSIYGGIALSTIGMVFAALGYIPPVFGALIQETIDIIVILNALRVLRV
jgi:P-type E1-E2 ATPase